MTSILKTDEIQSQNGGAVVKMQTLKHPSATGNNLELASDGSVSITNEITSGTFNGTIGDSATMSNKYWRTARLASDTTINSSLTRINTSTQTDPYFQAGDGDTTNLPYSDTNLVKVVRAGIYLVNFQATFYYPSNTASRAVSANIFYGTTTTVSQVSTAFDSIANITSSDDFGSATAVWVGHCATNSYLSFGVQGYDSATPVAQTACRYTIALIRPL